MKGKRKKPKEGGGFGLLGNIGMGVVGAFVGGFVFRLLGLSAGGFIGYVIMATAGAVIILYLVKVFRK